MTSKSDRIRVVSGTAQLRWCLVWLVPLAMWASAGAAASDAGGSDPADDLQARYAAFYERLADNPFPEHVEVTSFEGTHASGGDVEAAIARPFAAVREAFADGTAWCDALILHLNVKYCHPLAYDDRLVLVVALGRKHAQPLAQTDRMEFTFRVPAARPDYLAVELDAEEGPYGTGNYRIAFEAVGIGEGWSFVRLRYSYEYGVIGRLATQIYFATGGSGKPGFTVIDKLDQEQWLYVSGARGAIERNAMRYYLALVAYLDSRAEPVAQRFERSAERWFDATERYPLQLHEIEREAYLAMKRSEYARQQSAP